MSVLLTIGLTGCDPIETVETVSDRLENEIPEPQGNKQDYLLQDYDVVDVEDVDIDKLDAFDTSGPNYAGISEIGKNTDSSGSELTEDFSVTLSAYSLRKKSATTDPKLSMWLCRNSDSTNDIITALKDFEYYKDNYDENDDVDDVLAGLYAYYYNKNADSDEGRAEKAKIYSTVWGGNAESLRSRGFVTSAYHLLNNSTATTMEGKVLDELRSKLKKQGISAALNSRSYNSALNFREMGLSGAQNGSACHVVISANYGVNSAKYRYSNGWFVLYKGGTGESEKATEEFANLIYEKLKAKLGNLEASDQSNNGGTAIEGLRETSVYWDNVEYEPVLNYSSVPTVIVVMDNISSAADTTEMSKNIVRQNFVTAIAEAIAEMRGSNGD